MEMVPSIGSNTSDVQGFRYNVNVGGSNASSGQDVEEDVSQVYKEQDRLLPIANVGRIMKQILPPNAKISKEAKETIQECVSEFIAFVTGEASDRCRREKRKTVNGDDVCWAMSNLGFDDYVEPLKLYLQRIRALEGEKANQNKGGGGGGGGSSNGNEEIHLQPSSSSSYYRSGEPPTLFKFSFDTDKGRRF